MKWSYEAPQQANPKYFPGCHWFSVEDKKFHISFLVEVLVFPKEVYKANVGFKSPEHIESIYQKQFKDLNAAKKWCESKVRSTIANMLKQVPKTL
jgi:hypothetical protein